jgi:hypothetical protein
MPDYIELFCGMIERGHDMTDMDWSYWQELAAQMLYDFQPEDLDGVIIQ